jgi:hypothetical protein
MANTTLTTITAILQMNNTGFKQGLTGSQKALNYFQKQIKMVGVAIAGAFSVREIARFTKEAVMLSAEMEGVALAFDRVRPNTDFMAELQRATHNTVSELELMKTAVIASRFDISLKALPTLLQFATKYAQETGVAVDMLTDKIVRGIGRKSVLILDDLGLTATQIRAALGGVSVEAATVGELTEAIGGIAKKSLGETGDVVDTTKIKFEQLKTAVENAKTEVGKFFTGKFPLNEKYKELVNEYTIDPVWENFYETLDAISAEWMAKHQGELEETKNKIDEYNASLRKTDEIYNSLDLKNLFPTEFNVPLIKMGQVVPSLFGLSMDLGELNKKLFEEWLKDAEKKRNERELAQTLLDNLNEDIKNIISEGNPSPPNIWGYLVNEDEDIPDATTDAIIEKFKKTEEEAQQLTDQMNATLSQMASKGLSDLVSGITESLTNANISGIEVFFDNILKVFGDFFVQMGAMLIAYGVSMEAFKKAFTNPLAAIAAGIALVAIGGAIRGAHKNFAAGGFGGSANVPSTQGATKESVMFKIQGKDLVGTLKRYNDYNLMNT